jgi:Arc/MetJ-type ribon-helix-helix transcriptional regulator
VAPKRECVYNSYSGWYKSRYTKMETAPKKRRMPATERDAIIPVRLPKCLLEMVDNWAGRFEGMSRSEAIRCLLDLGLSSKHSQIVWDPKRKSFAPKIQKTPTAFDVVFADKPDAPMPSAPAAGSSYVKTVADPVEARAVANRKRGL